MVPLTGLIAVGVFLAPTQSVAGYLGTLASAVCGRCPVDRQYPGALRVRGGRGQLRRAGNVPGNEADDRGGPDACPGANHLTLLKIEERGSGFVFGCPPNLEHIVVRAQRVEPLCAQNAAVSNVVAARIPIPAGQPHLQCQAVLPRLSRCRIGHHPHPTPPIVAGERLNPQRRYGRQPLNRQRVGLAGVAVRRGDFQQNLVVAAAQHHGAALLAAADRGQRGTLADLDRCAGRGRARCELQMGYRVWHNRVVVGQAR